jgi:hypothetical protein
MPKPYQSLLNLPLLREVIVDDAPGVVILRVLDQHTGEECGRMEFTPDEADSMARHFWSASTCARANA